MIYVTFNSQIVVELIKKRSWLEGGFGRTLQRRVELIKKSQRVRSLVCLTLFE